MSVDQGAAAEPEYVLGTGEEERVRLGFQHQVWAEPTARAWEAAGFARGHRLLDVGCGPGYATLEMARLVGPRGHVTAVDVSPRFVAHLEEERLRLGLAHVETRLQDLGALDLPEGSVDGAFARWVLCFVRDPGEVVARVARALRPGGTFAVMDYYDYEGFTMIPPYDSFRRVVGAVARSFRQSGGNPEVGVELPGLMRRAGLEVRSLRAIVRTARPGSTLWDWPPTFFRNYLPALVEAGGITEEERLDFEREWRRREEMPDTFFLSPPMVELVAYRPE